MSLITVDNLSKQYPLAGGEQVSVLEQITFSVNAGEFVVIMGASGSGKSTLLQQMTALDQGYSGQVIFQGADLCCLSELEQAQLRLKHIGFIFQQHYLHPHLSLIDNIVLPGYLAKECARADVNASATALMERLGIRMLADYLVSQVSGGQAQRAAVCRALINSPAFIVGDEPTGALNASATAAILRLLCELRDAGKTILLATHDVSVAAQADRVLYLSDGRLLGEYYVAKQQQAGLSVEASLFHWLSERGF